MSNYVLIIDSNKQPLLPCKPSVARRLLDSGKAAVSRRFPFTLILKKAVEPVEKTLTLKIDPGSKFTGIALLDGNDVIWMLEVEHRGSLISKKLEKRSASRRLRRSRLRYRPPRLPNKKKPEGWLAPSLMHRVETTMTWVNRLTKLAAIKEIALELVRFDTQKINNPEISGTEYQQGTLYGYEVREYLLEKWSRKCAYCGTENTPLEVEHIHPKSRGGSDKVSNLPRSKSNSFNFTVPGQKAKSVHVKKLKLVHRKDGYTYTFCPQLSMNVEKNAS